MNPSKIQLLELTLVKSSVTANPLLSNIGADADSGEQSFELQSAKTIHEMPVDENLVEGDATTCIQHKVRLGIRTPLKHSHGFPYSFEVVFTGVILNTDPTDGDPQQHAVRYGLALLYGAIRDHVYGLTARMKHGPLLVPTMSFMDESYEKLFETHQRLIGGAKPTKETRATKRAPSLGSDKG